MIHFFNVSVSWLNEVLGLLELAYILSPCVVFLNMIAEKQLFSFRFRQGGKRTIIEQTKRKKCCQNTKIRVSLVWTNDNNQMHYPQKKFLPFMEKKKYWVIPLNTFIGCLRLSYEGVNLKMPQVIYYFLK